MSGPVSVPVVHRRAGVTVKVDPDALAYWKARGLPERWTWTETGPTYSVDGEDRSVIETILGRPGKLGPAGSFDLTLSNLIPLDGSEPNLKALEFDLEDVPVAAADPGPDIDVAEAVARFGRPDVVVAGSRAPVTTTTQTNPDGTVITIYALYYTGDDPTYAAIANANREGRWRWPIYVGKAVPSGARKALTTTKRGTWLYSRLREHAESVTLAENLRIEDFHCRFLVVEDIWIPLGESLLIAKFTPVWNRMIDGFGNHDPGAGRYKGMRPRWDVLHPGRAWALKCAERPETPELIASEIEAHLRTAPVPGDDPRLLLDPPEPDYDDGTEEE